MRDPDVVSLRYRVETDGTVSYKDAPPVEHKTDCFTLRLADDVLSVKMKEHFPSVKTAREVVDKFLRGWELDVALRRGPGELQFVYEDANVIDRNPPPDTCQTIELSIDSCWHMNSCLTLHLERNTYPDPPKSFCFSPDVETMWLRYQGYKNGREPLLAMAYLCLTIVKSRAGGIGQAAHQFSVDKALLNKLGEISSTRGDMATARKVNRTGVSESLTETEIAWTEAAVRTLIRRIGEYDAAPGDSLPLLTMKDLPPV